MYRGLYELISSYLGSTEINGMDAATAVYNLTGFPIEVCHKLLYVVGASDGGMGTYGMVPSYPDLFKAAMPVEAGYCRPSMETKMFVVVLDSKYNQSVANQVESIDNVRLF